MEECRIVIAGELGVDRLPYIFSRLEPLWDPFISPCQVHLDLRGVTFITPSAVTLLTTAILRLKQDGFQMHVTRPEKENVDGYLTRMDFYELMGMDVEYTLRRRNADGRFREVVQVQTEEEGDAVVQDLMTILDRNIVGVAGIRDAVYHTFLEIVNNVFHHAHSPTHAIICSQLYSTFRRVELAVVDSGRGIPNSLRQNPELRGRFSNAAEAVALAVQPRVTGRPEHNTGEGLFFSTEFIKANGGKACIYSQDGILWVRGGEVTTGQAAFWPGTLVALRFCTDSPVNVRAIFDQYAPPENDFDWLF
jgi:hypothetical protein